MFKVLKKDGTLEDFDWKKVMSGIMGSGATQDEAEKVAEKVEIWLTAYADDGTVKSYDLHMKVIEVLKSVNETVAKNFEEFKKPELQ